MMRLRFGGQVPVDLDPFCRYRFFPLEVVSADGTASAPLLILFRLRGRLGCPRLRFRRSIFAIRSVVTVLRFRF